MLDLVWSLADQSFSQSKSLGILNMACSLLEHVQSHREVGHLHVLSNSDVSSHLSLAGGNVSESIHNEVNGSRLRRIWWDQVSLYRRANSKASSWLILPKGFTPLLGRPPCKLAPIIPDVMHDHYARHHPKVVNRFEQAYFAASQRASLKHANAILTISDFSAKEITRVAKAWGITPPPITSIGIGFRDEKPGVEADRDLGSILIPTSRWPHKRTTMALQYLDRWQQETRHRGPVHWIGSLPDDAERPTHPNWRYHARLPESEYRTLMSTSGVLAYFSEYEGFGMPPVEALLAGACPLVSDLPVTRDVMQENAFFFLNGDYPTFSDALDKALHLPYATKQQWRKEVLARHTWESVTDKFVKALMDGSSA